MCWVSVQEPAGLQTFLAPTPHSRLEMPITFKVASHDANEYTGQGKIDEITASEVLNEVWYSDGFKIKGTLLTTCPNSSFVGINQSLKQDSRVSTVIL
jgi:hypothetical protein